MAENTVRQIRWFWGWHQANPLPGVPDSVCLIYVPAVEQYYKSEIAIQRFFPPVVRQSYSVAELDVEEGTLYSDYHLWEEFVVDTEAPLPSPREAYPGPGMLQSRDVDSQMNISGGMVHMDGSGLNNNPSIVTYEIFGRASGLAILTKVRFPSLQSSRIGWGSDLRYNFVGQNFFNLGLFETGNMVISERLSHYIIPPSLFSPIVPEEWTYFLVSLRSEGALFFMKPYGKEWELIMATAEAAGSLVTAHIHNHSSSLTAEYMKVDYLPDPFDSDFGYATFNSVSPPVGTVFTHELDTIIIFSVTSFIGTISVLFRERWKVVFDYASSVLSLYKRNSVMATYSFPSLEGEHITVMSKGVYITVHIGEDVVIEYEDSTTGVGGEVLELNGSVIENLAAFPKYPSGTALEELEKRE